MPGSNLAGEPAIKATKITGALAVGSLCSIVLVAVAGCASRPAAVTGPTSACQVQRPAALVDIRVSLPHPSASDTIKIRPGETLCVQLVMTGNHLLAKELLSEVPPDAWAILVVTLRENHGSTTLTVLQHVCRLGCTLRYRAAIRVAGDPVIQPATTCPVLSGRPGIEIWPYKIEELTLTDLGLMTPGDTMKCKMKHQHLTLAGNNGEILPYPGR